MLIEDQLRDTMMKRAFLRSALPALTLAFFSVMVLESSQRISGLDVFKLSTMQEGKLFLPDRRVSHPDSSRQKRALMFLDLGCGTCRRTLTELIQKGKSVDLCIRFAKPMTEYAKEAVLTFLSARSEQERTTVVSEILEDESRTVDPLFRLRDRLKLGPPQVPAHMALEEDNALAEQLHIKAVPVIIGWPNLKPAPLSVEDVLS
jgi:hypothetical protein